MKLLIAVTSEVTADLLASSLPMYDVTVCHTGTDALALLETHRPDVMILDLALPVLDGLTVLRKTGFKPHMILALTSFSSAAVLQAAADAGVQDVLFIPSSIRYIIKRLDALTGKAPSPEA